MARVEETGLNTSKDSSMPKSQYGGVKEMEEKAAEFRGKLRGSEVTPD